MLYGVAAIIGVIGLGVSITEGSFNFPLFAWAFGIAFNTLVLDIICSIGESLVRIEAEQSFMRLWIEQLNHKSQ